jgi:hypothetical protein
MKLKRPTDFLILEYLEEEGRNVAPNIGAGIGKKKSYINCQLPMLHAYGLVDKIGPSEYSGLYEITNRGRAVLKHREKYGEKNVDFEQLIEETAENLDEDTEREATAD